MIKGRMPRWACGPFLMLVALASCSEDSYPSQAENEQLENAAEMLDSAPATLEDIDENALGEAGRDTDPATSD